MTIAIEGRLLAATDNGSVELAGAGGAVTVSVGGRPSIPSRASIARVAQLVDAGGLDVEIVDDRGRRLAEFGRGVQSPIGRLVFGSPSVKPAPRGVARWLRSLAGPRTHKAKGQT